MRIRRAACFLLSIALIFWVRTIASQHDAWLIAGVMLAVIWTLLVAIRFMFKSREVTPTVIGLVGVACGYFAGVIGAQAGECALRGAFDLSRLGSNMWFFPLISLSWLYGGLVFCTLLNRTGFREDQLA